jgi:hypothetical protein
MGQSQEKHSDHQESFVLTGVLPAVSNFVGISTLLKSQALWLSVWFGFFIAVVNVIALYQHDKKPTYLTRGFLLFLEVVGIFCIAYDAIQCLHSKTPAILPEPFNDLSIQTKAWMGIGLLIITLFFALVMMYLESCAETKKVVIAKRLITGGIVFVGTYPLMISYFLGLHYNSCTIWLIIAAISVSLCSSTGQAFLISRHENNEQSPADRKQHMLLEWCGKFFMSGEIILSLANTAFSAGDSSVDECLHLFKNRWINQHSRSIGLVLFIVSIILFLTISYKHFKPLCASSVTESDRSYCFFCSANDI